MREIGLLELRGGRRAGIPGGKLAVDLHEVPREEGQRPAVGHAMVHGQRQRVLFRREADQRGPEQRAPQRLESGRRQLAEDPHRLGLPADRTGKALQVHQRQRRGHQVRRGDGHQLAVAGHVEAGAQRLMALHHGPDAPGEDLRVERPAQSDGVVHVVGEARGPAFGEPHEPALAERGGSGAPVRPRDDARILLRRPGRAAAAQPLLQQGPLGRREPGPAIREILLLRHPSSHLQVCGRSSRRRP